LIWLGAQALKLRDAARRQTIDRVRVMLVGQYLFVFALWFMWQSLGHVALQPDYFAYPLIVPAFLALGAMAQGARWRELVLLGAALAGLYFTDEILARANVTWWTNTNALLTAFVVILAAIAAGVLPRFRAMAVTVAAIVVLAAYPAMIQQGRGLWTQSNPPNTCDKPRQVFLEIVRLTTKLHETSSPNLDTYLWWGPDEQPDWMCDIPVDYFRGALIAAGSVNPLNPPPEKSADQIRPEDMIHVQRGDRVITILQKEGDATPLLARFASDGRILKLEATDRVNFNGRVAYVSIFRNTSEPAR
jgi:hypothetical protein